MELEVADGAEATHSCRQDLLRLGLASEASTIYSSSEALNTTTHIQTTHIQSLTTPHTSTRLYQS